MSCSMHAGLVVIDERTDEKSREGSPYHCWRSFSKLYANSSKSNYSHIYGSYLSHSVIKSRDLKNIKLRKTHLKVLQRTAITLFYLKQHIIKLQKGPKLMSHKVQIAKLLHQLNSTIYLGHYFRHRSWGINKELCKFQSSKFIKI